MDDDLKTFINEEITDSSDPVYINRMLGKMLKHHEDVNFWNAHFNTDGDSLSSIFRNRGAEYILVMGGGIHNHFTLSKNYVSLYRRRHIKKVKLLALQRDIRDKIRQVMFIDMLQ